MHVDYLDGIVGALGTTAPVITECADFFHRRYGRPPSQIHLILSKSEEVQRQSILVHEALRHRFGDRILVKNHQMDFEDLEDYQKVLSFMKLCKNAIVDIRESYPAAKIGFLMSGGRKTESVCGSFISAYMGVDAILHVHSKLSSYMNPDFEKIRAHIEQLSKADDKSSFYSQNSQLFEGACFPPAHTYELISVLVPPIPPKFLDRLLEALGQTPATEQKLRLSISEQELAEAISKGFLRKHGSLVNRTEKGEALLKIFL